MSGAQLEIQLLAVVVAVACALPGVFLVLRRMALLSDAISHSVLVGIVVAFLVVKDLASPLLILGAAATGVLTVSLIELLQQTRLVRQDAAIGVVFPFLFSLGVILVSRYAGSVHLDVDSVLLGELAFAPFRRFAPGGHDLGPLSLWIMGGILILNVLFLAFFYKELKLATFDRGLATALGFSPAAIHYALMSLVSVTAVGAFDAVGSVLVVALMIAPPATAYLLTHELRLMIILAALLGAAGAIAGYWAAHLLDVSIAGSIATMNGILFVGAWLSAPGRGLLVQVRRRSEQRRNFALRMLAVHLYQHEEVPGEEGECELDHLLSHLRWDRRFADGVLRRARRQGLVGQVGNRFTLTSEGRRLAREAMVG